MPDIGQLCAHLIRLIHAPIRVYDRAGTLTAIFVDKGEQQDVLACDRAMRDELLALARQLDVSADHLSRQFARETGEMLTDHILQTKIKVAKDQLIYSDDSYEAIAMGLGFTSQSHFGQVFKRYTGMTPKRFRDLHAAEPPAKPGND